MKFLAQSLWASRTSWLHQVDRPEPSTEVLCAAVAGIGAIAAQRYLESL